MIPIRLGLASKSQSVRLADLAHVAGAIGVQLVRDFQPLWNIQATIAALPDPDAVPPGVWPIFITDDAIQNGALGLHLTKAGQPYAVVQAGASWSLAASHECLEMLVDPNGNRLVTSTGIEIVDGLIKDAPGQKFNYIMEISDPSEDPANAYLIDDVLVSDFYTSHFFDVAAASGVRYSFTGKITRPRQILANGYISWLDPGMNTLFQLQNFGAPQILSGSPTAAKRGSLRGASDHLANSQIKFSDVDLERAAGGYGEARSEWLRRAAMAHARTYYR